MNTKITASNPRPSDCCDTADARDVDIVIEISGRTLQGELTMLPARDGSGYVSWGEPSNWIDDATLSTLFELGASEDVFHALAQVGGCCCDGHDAEDCTVTIEADEDMDNFAVVKSEDMDDNGNARQGAPTLYTGSQSECQAYAEEHAEDYHYGLEVVAE